MRHPGKHVVAGAAAILVGLGTPAAAFASPATASAQSIVTETGTLPSGGRYLVEVPDSWNGTLYVFNPGFIGTAGQPPRTSSNPTAREWLLANGYAVAGSQPVGTGWAVEEIMPDAVATVDVVQARFGAPRRTIAWGTSMGGQVAAGLLQYYPDRFDGAVPLCGSVAGPLGMLNAGLDAAFAFKTLLAPDSGLELVDVTDEAARTAQARSILDAAQATPQGRARIALAASFMQLSTWSVPGTSKPAPDDYAGQQWQQYMAFMFAVFSPRLPLEQRAGGNFSWNVGVDYRRQLDRSGTQRQVRALYREAGLNLDKDLLVLARAPRISADPSAVDYMRRNVTPTGEIEDPVLTLHETGDNAPTVTQASAYARAVAAEGNRHLLRQAFVDRPGHCNYTAAEIIASMQTLERRLDRGSWGDSATARELNRLAAELDAASPLELGTAGFSRYDPDRFLRPYYPRDQRI
jgi:pimeloyl-ACP methyl ester carboxylesterase